MSKRKPLTKSQIRIATEASKLIEAVVARKALGEGDAPREQTPDSYVARMVPDDTRLQCQILAYGYDLYAKRNQLVARHDRF